MTVCPCRILLSSSISALDETQHSSLHQSSHLTSPLQTVASPRTQTERLTQHLPPPLTTESSHRAEQLPSLFPDTQNRPPLYGIPISIKDCFDVAGNVTTCGSRFYAEINPPAEKNSWVAQRLLDAGAILTGKTHLHQLAYGVTGENADYGDCVQPRDATLLTGGSSSGAAASVQEGSALVAIGTDTGGSVRVPSTLCGLAGYRASHGRQHAKNAGPAGTTSPQPLIPSASSSAIFATPPPSQMPSSTSHPFFSNQGSRRLRQATTSSTTASLKSSTPTKPGSNTSRTTEPHFPRSTRPSGTKSSPSTRPSSRAKPPPSIAATSSTSNPSSPTVSTYRSLHPRCRTSKSPPAPRHPSAIKCPRSSETFDFLIAPCVPVSKLEAGRDHTESRKAILRYTTPASLAGLPAVTLPGTHRRRPRHRRPTPRRSHARPIAARLRLHALTETEITPTRKKLTSKSCP